MGKSRGIFDRLRTVLLILGVIIVLGILGYAFSVEDDYTWQEGELLTPDKLNELARKPAQCNDTNEILHFDGSNWQCVEIPAPPVCNETHEVLQFDGSEWSCIDAGPPTCTGSDKALQFDGTDWICTTIDSGGEGGISLGDWEEKSFNTIYDAESDGIVVAYVRPPVSDDVSYMAGYCGPTGSGIPEIRARVYAARGDPIQQAAITMPVKSGDKWKVGVSDKDNRNPPYDPQPVRSRVWWIPLDGGGSLPPCLHCTGSCEIGDTAFWDSDRGCYTACKFDPACGH